MTILVVAVIVLISLAEAAIFHLYSILKWNFFLKGKIDSISLTCPVEGFVFIHITWIPAGLVLGLISGSPDLDLRGLFAVPAFILWGFILKKPANLWCTNMEKKIKLSPERAQELAQTSANADFLISGGLG